MGIVILPGKSAKNVSWYYEAKKMFADFEFVKYNHWKNEKFNYKEDLKQVKEFLKKDSAVIGKSLGAVYAMTSENVKVRVLCGLPLMFARVMGFDLLKLLNETKVKTLVIQNENDPSGKFSAIKVSNPNVELVKLDGDTHDYSLKEIYSMADSKGYFN